MLNIYARSFMTATRSEKRVSNASRHPDAVLPRLSVPAGRTADSVPDRTTGKSRG
ncbi:hypothetical protein [Pseudooceanicola algae]|uniref:Uncharacterized protein n=1 Tax=Pseudooceanicola algae TaxID=1537215 RepID=A0A418SIE9_9RHOB|nr:hypothetical protein [Pseudooceanicola algae]QPM91112.1 hypothetical protein PSAL_023610 [Pseudooceanicola algae]